MSLLLADRVQESTTTTGTGTLTLAGAITGYRTFASVFANGSTVAYCIFMAANGTWEVGQGTLVTPTTLSRDSVQASSNGNALVNFIAGSKYVFITIPASLVNLLGALPTSGGTGQYLKQATAGAAVSVGTIPAGDVPNLPASIITSGQLALARGGTGVDLSASGSTTAILAQDASHVISARSLVAGDIPSLAASIITSGQLALARGGTNADLSATGGANQFLKQSGSGAAVTVGTIASADIATALTTPGVIGGGTPAAGTFTTLTSTSHIVNGTGGAGYLELANQSSAPGTPSSAARLYVDNTNHLSWKGTNGFVRSFDATANLADRVYTLPDFTGTVILSTANNVIQPGSDIVGLTVTGFSTSQASNLAKIQKSDGTGFTAIGPTGALTVQGDVTTAVLGSEKVTNGGFATDLSGWTATTWTWSSTRANFAGGTGAISSIKLINGGTAYAVNDVLTLTNGANDATVIVTSVSSGKITGFNLTNAGTACTVASGVAVTGGTGTGATFLIERLVDSANTLTQDVSVVNAGIYLVVYTIQNRTAGELNLTLGGVSGHRVSSNATFSQMITATGTGVLTFTPTADFVGAVTNVSVKLITVIAPQQKILNSDGSAGLELRAGVSGGTSVYVGFQAGEALTTGNANVALGVNALLSNTTGAAQVAIGHRALQNNTTGASNTAVGRTALQNNTTGVDNTAVGRDVLTNNTTGGTNTAIGRTALNANTTGGTNVAVGNATLANNTTGASNTAVGQNALNGNITGGSNVAVGQGAMVASVTASNNVSIGASSLSKITTGGNNTALGNNALLNNIAGTLNVALGFSAGNFEMGSNRLYVAVTTTMTPLVWGDFTNLILATSGELAIKHQNPQSASLDIAGADTTSSNFALKARQLGAELITVTADRDMSGANNWTGTGWAVGSGVFLHTAGNTADASLLNANLTTGQIISGDLYQITFTIASATAGTVTPKLGTAAGSAVGQNTTYVQWIAANANNSNLLFTPTTDFNGSLDNISVKRQALIASIDDTGLAIHQIQDAGTNAVVNALQLGHDTTGTPAAGFGTGLLMTAQDSTTVDTSIGSIQASWVVATHASRTGRMVFNAFDTAVREGLRIEASGSAAMIGFLGSAAQVQQASGANLTNNMTVGGTTDQVDTWTNLSTYSTDAAAIRNACYQMARKLKQVNDALRLYGLLT